MTKEKKYTGWFVDWREQWSQFFSACNWYTFQLILIEFEDDRIMGGVEFTIMILGLGVRVRWNYAETEQVKEIAETVKKIEAGEIGTMPFKGE